MDLRQSALGGSPLHRTATRGGLDIVSALRKGPVPPCAARSGPGIEKFHIRFDDPVRVHRSVSRGTGTNRNPLKHPKDWEIRPAIVIRSETEHGNHPGFAAGTQDGAGVGHRVKESPGKGNRYVWGIDPTRPAAPSGGQALPTAARQTG